MITGEQFRAARALLRLEQSEVAEVSGVSLPTIKRLEAASGPISANTGTRDALVRAFNQAGVVFVDDNGQGTGVRFRRPKHAERAKERLDEALEGMARDGIEPLDIQLTAADSAVLQRALGLAEAPSDYLGVPMRKTIKANCSAVRAAHPTHGARLHRLF